MHYKRYKSIVSPRNGMNVYRGCSHGCIYCDSRSVCYQINHDFEDIEVKKDAALILEEQLERRRKPAMIMTGAMCDPYIPLEEELCVTQQCLKVIERHRFGVALLTKSARIRRDIGLLERINAQSRAVVQMTLTTYDEDVCRMLEPCVSTTAERFEVLMAMRDAGIPTAVWLSPVLPFINDTEENLRGILDYCFAAQVKAIVFYGFGMTLREGNREYYYQQLDRLFPGMKEQYVQHFKNAYQCISPHDQKLKKILFEECAAHGVLVGFDEVFAYLRQYKLHEQLPLF